MCYSVRFLVPLILLALLATPGVGLAQRAYSNIGRTPSQEEIQSLGVIVDPLGKNLPPGKGTAKEGAEIYALTAYLLYMNGIIQDTDVMDAQSLPKVQMPNRDNFVPAKPVWPPNPKRPSWF